MLPGSCSDLVIGYRKPEGRGFDPQLRGAVPSLRLWWLSPGALPSSAGTKVRLVQSPGATGPTGAQYGPSVWPTKVQCAMIHWRLVLLIQSIALSDFTELVTCWWHDFRSVWLKGWLKAFCTEIYAYLTAVKNDLKTTTMHKRLEIVRFTFVEMTFLS